MASLLYRENAQSVCAETISNPWEVQPDTVVQLDDDFAMVQPDKLAVLRVASWRLAGTS